jgi:hypothetical protein
MKKTVVRLVALAALALLGAGVVGVSVASADPGMTYDTPGMTYD